eukprot:scaffold444_cov42-Cyclotella_meneghiniana.AAC.4
MRVDLIAISYCSLPVVYLKSLCSRISGVIDTSCHRRLTCVIVCDACFNALLLSLSLKAAELFGALLKF